MVLYLIYIPIIIILFTQIFICYRGAKWALAPPQPPNLYYICRCVATIILISKKCLIIKLKICELLSIVCQILYEYMYKFMNYLSYSNSMIQKISVIFNFRCIKLHPIYSVYVQSCMHIVLNNSISVRYKTSLHITISQQLNQQDLSHWPSLLRMVHVCGEKKCKL